MGAGGDKTTMVLQVDLQCSSCKKKVKKILDELPQEEIRDQVYDEKNNTVTITVVCCDPEELRDKLYSKGPGVIQSIEIKEPPMPKAPEKPKEPEKPKAPEKPEKPKPQPVAPPPAPECPCYCCGHPPARYCCGQCYAGHTCYRRPVPPPPCSDYYVCYGPCRCRRGCYVSRCDHYYFSDENATGCSIM